MPNVHHRHGLSPLSLFLFLSSLTTSILSQATLKGSIPHKLSGWLFAGLMCTVAFIGGPLDLTRLLSPLQPYNDINLPGYATPSTSPSHLGFFHAGFSLISMLIQALFGKNLSDFTNGLFLSFTFLFSLSLSFFVFFYFPYPSLFFLKKKKKNSAFLNVRIP